MHVRVHSLASHVYCQTSALAILLQQGPKSDSIMCAITSCQVSLVPRSKYLVYSDVSGTESQGLDQINKSPVG